jgi:hypothetical protein
MHYMCCLTQLLRCWAVLACCVLNSSRDVLCLLQPGVFDFGSRSSPVVLLLDRCDDPVTPLLMQWTYQVRAAHVWTALLTVLRKLWCV